MGLLERVHGESETVVVGTKRRYGSDRSEEKRPKCWRSEVELHNANWVKDGVVEGEKRQEGSEEKSTGGRGKNRKEGASRM